MKIRLLLSLAGLAIGLALPIFAQEQKPVDPEVRQQTGRILERLHTIQNKQGSATRDELRQSFAFLPRRSELWIWISKPSESRVKKFICGQSLPTSALVVEGPAKNELRRTIMFSSHPSEPMVDERGLTHTGPSNDCNDVLRMKISR